MHKWLKWKETWRRKNKFFYFPQKHEKQQQRKFFVIKQTTRSQRSRNKKILNFLIHLSPFQFLNLIFCHNKTLMFEVNESQDAAKCDKKYTHFFLFCM